MVKYRGKTEIGLDANSFRRILFVCSSRWPQVSCPQLRREPMPRLRDARQKNVRANEEGHRQTGKLSYIMV